MAELVLKKAKKKTVSPWTPVHTKSMENVEGILHTIQNFDAFTLHWLVQEIESQKKRCTDRDAQVKANLTQYSRWITTMRNRGGWSRDVSRVVSRDATPEQVDDDYELDFAEYEREGYEDEQMEDAEEA